MRRKSILRLFSLLLTAGLLFSIIGCTTARSSQVLPARERLRLATTTSLYDTGLWGYLEPIFERKYNVELDVLYAGSGIALEYGRRGDVDLITIHDKAREQQFVSDGYGAERVPFAYNYFLLVGPASDPAGIKGMKPEDALKRLANSGTAPFISRGDESGTHAREQAIWKSAGFDYERIKKAGPWYIEGGKGMGPTLLMASQKQGYTLTDAATFLAFKGRLDLAPLVDRGSILLNVYSVIAVNPEKNPKVAPDAQKARDMVSFLTSTEIQKLIGDYGVQSYGTPLFIPCAGKPEPAE